MKTDNIIRVAVIGSREFKDFTLIDGVLDEFLHKQDYPIIISGGAKGVDRYAEEYGFKNNIQRTIYPANWNKYGKRAGALRNQEIVDASDYVIAFWDGKSKGTKITIDMAIRAGKPIDIYVRN